MGCPNWEKCTKKTCIEQSVCMGSYWPEYWKKKPSSLKPNIKEDGLYAQVCPLCERLYGEIESRTKKIRIKTKDHLVPKSKGGSQNKINFFYCCNFCNHKKGNMYLSEFIVFLQNKLDSMNDNTRHISPLWVILKNVILLEDRLQPYNQAMFRFQNSEYSKKYTKYPPPPEPKN